MKPIIHCSSIDRILNCAHSAWLPQEEYTNEYADAGTEQHKLAAKYLTHHRLPDLNNNTTTYVRAILDIRQSHYDVYLMVECSASLEFPNYILKGTPDCWFIEDRTLHIFDLKNGETILVEPNCLQLLGYAFLLSKKHYDNFDTIKTYIVQNCEVKSYEVETCELEMLKLAIEKSLKDHTYELGEHCGWCQSKIHCLKMRQQVDNVLTIKDNNAVHATLKHKTKIEKTLKELFITTLSTNPEWFDKKGRNYKEWIDKNKLQIKINHLTPSQALKNGYDVQSNIKTIVKHHYVVKNAYK